MSFHIPIFAKWDYLEAVVDLSVEPMLSLSLTVLSIPTVVELSPSSQRKPTRGAALCH